MPMKMQTSHRESTGPSASLPRVCVPAPSRRCRRPKEPPGVHRATRSALHSQPPPVPAPNALTHRRLDAARGGGLGGLCATGAVGKGGSDVRATSTAQLVSPISTDSNACLRAPAIVDAHVPPSIADSAARSLALTHRSIASPSAVRRHLRGWGGRAAAHSELSCEYSGYWCE